MDFLNESLMSIIRIIDPHHSSYGSPPSIEEMHIFMEIRNSTIRIMDIIRLQILEIT